jgi:hypothetical protein
VFFNIENQRGRENVKTIRDSSTNYNAFNHTNFSQTQTGAAVSLKNIFETSILKKFLS